MNIIERAPRSSSLELWGGYECTVNRVGDRWHDQTLRSGHERRIEDLAMFADLGMRALRYPALWERISPDHPEKRDFRWTDERLPEIRRLGMEPIVTLSHHGAGPAYTNLTDDGFAWGLARHAAAVAERYPWLRDWTPVNEPLTTARFSALYGFWHPHAKDERLFWLALLNQVDATRLSMQAIRRINPSARLIQTDDLGYCHSTERCRAHATFQNARRWMGWDLLCGMVVPGHAMWKRLAGFGFTARLRAIADDPCPPDVIGVNHYLSSERLLDDRLDRYTHRAVADRGVGVTDGVAHVDVDAVSHAPDQALGVARLLEQAWERYKLPLAVTECHNAATRCDQVRWFVDVWNEVLALRQRGVDVGAVTAWALLGSHDWNLMLTRFDGHYETGVFDVRTGSPRPTLLARVLRDLAAGRVPDTPVLHGPGRWRLEARERSRFEIAPGPRAPGTPGPLLIIDDGGPLAGLAVQACEARRLTYTRVSTDAADAIAAPRPWGVLDARDHDGVCGKRDMRLFGHWATERLAETCARLAVPGAVIASQARHGAAPEGSRLLVARTGPLYLSTDSHARACVLLDALDAGEAVSASAEPWEHVYGPDVIDGIIDLLLDDVRGIVSFVPLETTSEAEFARALALIAGADQDAVRGPEPIQVKVSGACAAGSHSPPMQSTVERFARERRAARRHSQSPPLGIDGLMYVATE